MPLPVLGLLLATLLQGAEDGPIADTVVLTSGKEVVGTLLVETEDEVMLIDRIGRERKLQRKKIETMRGPRGEYADYLDRLDRVYAARASPADALGLARWCEARGMHADAELHRWRALALDPADPKAHEALGHRKGLAGWEVPLPSGGRVAYEDHLKLRLQKDKPWELGSLHVRARINGSLEAAVLAVAGAERGYGHARALLRRFAPVQDLLTPLELRIFRDRREAYPEAGERRRGYVEPLTGEVGSWFVDDRGADLDEALARGFLRAWVRQHASTEADALPAWFDDGFGLVVAACLRPTEGLSDWHPGRLDVDLIERALEDDGPLALDTLLAVPRDGLADTADEAGARAAAYGFAWWLLHHEDPKVLAAVGDFLEKLLADRAGASTLRKALPRRFDRRLEEEWTDFLGKSVLRRRR